MFYGDVYCLHFYIGCYSFITADVMLYLLSESSLSYVYAVGKQPISND